MDSLDVLYSTESRMGVAGAVAQCSFTCVVKRDGIPSQWRWIAVCAWILYHWLFSILYILKGGWSDSAKWIGWRFWWTVNRRFSEVKTALINANEAQTKQATSLPSTSNSSHFRQIKLTHRLFVSSSFSLVPRGPIDTIGHEGHHVRLQR